VRPLTQSYGHDAPGLIDELELSAHGALGRFELGEIEGELAQEYALSPQRACRRS
jgi:hypothetical protein